jgi:hypothetical protein
LNVTQGIPQDTPDVIDRQIRRAYDLNGLTLVMAAAEEKPCGFLEPILAPLGCAVPAAPDWLISLAPVESVKWPGTGTRLFEGPLPEGLQAVMIVDGAQRSLVVPDHFAMQCRRPCRRTDIHFVPGKENSLGGTAAFWLLDDVLTANDRYLVHGGLLVNPETDRAIAIFAPSGTGKTTTVLALARAGFRLAGDDALVLDAAEGACGLWAVPRYLKIHRRTVALLPWLGPVTDCPWLDDEQTVALTALEQLVALAEPRRRLVELVIVLMPPNENDHVVTAIGKPDALAAIVSDNIRVAPGGVDADNAAALAALTKLVAGTRVIALSAGPNLSTLASAITRATPTAANLA